MAEIRRGIWNKKKRSKLEDTSEGNKWVENSAFGAKDEIFVKDIDPKDGPAKEDFHLSTAGTHTHTHTMWM